MADIFISYAGEDRPWVEKFASALAEQGWSVWWDRSIPFGQSYQTVIEQALADAHCVFVIWSAHSVDSSWVWAEAEEARNRNILIPVIIDNSQPPLVFRQIQTADLSQWQTDPPAPLEPKLLRDLESLIGRATQPSMSLQSPVSYPSGSAEQPASVIPSNKSEPILKAEKTTKNSLVRFLVPIALLVLAVVAAFFFFNANQSSWPKVEQFSAEPATVIIGDEARLIWHTENALRVELIGVGQLATSGSTLVRPEKTTLYTLIVSNNTGHSIRRDIEVTVVANDQYRNVSEQLDELLEMSRQAIKTRDFQQAEALLKEAKSIAPGSEAIQITIDYFAAEVVKELLSLSRQAIQARNFEEAKDLLSQAQQAAPDDENVQQTVDYYKASKTLYEQRLAAEKRLQELQLAEEKAKALQQTATAKEQAAEKYQREMEAKRRHQAYEIQQRELEQIRAQELMAAEQREREMTDAQRLQIEEDERARSAEEDAYRKEKIKDFLKSIRR